MASINDYTGSDGILRSLLSKTVNNRPVPIYPRTHAEIVLYDNTTVKAKLDDLVESFGNLTALLSSSIVDLKELKSNTYDRTYIDALALRLQTAISDINVAVINIQEFTNNLSYYTQDQINQFILNINETFSRNIANVAILLDEATANLSKNYYTTVDVDNKVFMINQDIERIRLLVDRDISNKLLQFNIDAAETIQNGFSNYYNKSEVDNTTQQLSDSIDSLENTLSVLRGDTITMNAESISNINEHTDHIKNNIIIATNNRTASLEENFNSQIDNQTTQLTTLLAQVLGAVNSVNSASAARINNIYSNLSAQIRSLGATGGVAITYENADEEEY